MVHVNASTPLSVMCAVTCRFLWMRGACRRAGLPACLLLRDCAPVFVRCLACLVGGFCWLTLPLWCPPCARALPHVWCVSAVPRLSCLRVGCWPCVRCVHAVCPCWIRLCLRDDDHESRFCPCRAYCARLPRCLPAWRGHGWRHWHEVCWALGACLAADQCGIAWQWQIIGQREAGQQCSSLRANKMRNMTANPPKTWRYCIASSPCVLNGENVLNSPLCGVKFRIPIEQLVLLLGTMEK